MAKIAFLGTGAMGSRMARVLVDAGHEVTVWNRSAERTVPLVEAGARAATTPRAAADGAGFVVAMVRDDEASRYVWLDPEAGALAGLALGATAIECSTISVAWARALAARFDEAGVEFLDAPVVGSRPQAQAGQLIFLAGGDAAVLERARPVLDAMGSAVHHAGPAGAGASVKLAINALLGVQVALMGEVIPMLEACGLEPARAAEIIAATPVCSPAAKVAAGSIVARNFAPLFPVELVEKDLGYALGATDGRMPITAAARAVFEEAAAKHLGGDHMTSVSRLYRD